VFDLRVLLISRLLRNKIRTETQLTFYKDMAVPDFNVWEWEMDLNRKDRNQNNMNWDIRFSRQRLWW
jgi:hypothetical protein